jgi:glutamate synthase (NADPH/NADH) small chain
VADTLNKMGYNVTVFDEAAKPGGILRYGIPEFKLSKAVVDRRLKLMEEEGVRFETRVRVGEDISYRYLRDRFAAVCLTAGAREPRELDVPGRRLGGVHQALEYLSQQNRRLAGEIRDGEEAITAEGKAVVVIGGGDTGSDCLGTAIRQGARRVTQLEILPEPPRTRSPATPWPQWPHMLRSSSSHKEGGERRWSVSTRELQGEDGRVRALRGFRVEWEKPPGGGRPVVKEMAGTDFEVEAELVLLAMGFVGPKRNRIVEDLGLETGPGGLIRRDARSMTSLPGIFVAGDMSSGATLVVRAIADGRRAAQSISGYIDESRSGA